MLFASSGWAPGAVVAPERTGNSRVAVNLPRGWSGGGGDILSLFLRVWMLPSSFSSVVSASPPRALSGL